jgi:uridylate kinase
MDMSAIQMCLEGKIPILVFNFKRPGNIERAVLGQKLGTLVTEKA